MISTNLRIISIVGSLALLLFILELVRRRRLKEEYTVLWLATAIALLVLAATPTLIGDISRAIGAFSQTNALFFFGLIFVILLLLYFSIRVSQLERRVVSLLQEVALLGDPHRKASMPDGAPHEQESAAKAEPGSAPPA